MNVLSFTKRTFQALPKLARHFEYKGTEVSASIRKKIPAVWCEGAHKNPDRLESLPPVATF
jgi:hypothetical protein